MNEKRSERVLDTITPDTRKPIIHHEARCQGCDVIARRASEDFARMAAELHVKDSGHSVQIVEVAE